MERPVLPRPHAVGEVEVFRSKYPIRGLVVGSSIASLLALSYTFAIFILGPAFGLFASDPSRHPAWFATEPWEWLLITCFATLLHASLGVLLGCVAGVSIEVFLSKIVRYRLSTHLASLYGSGVGFLVLIAMSPCWMLFYFHSLTHNNDSFFFWVVEVLPCLIALGGFGWMGRILNRSLPLGTKW